MSVGGVCGVGCMNVSLGWRRTVLFVCGNKII